MYYGNKDQTFRGFFLGFFATGDNESLLWVDKYRPRSLKQIIGQQGDKSNVKKLLKWLTNWYSNRNKPHAKSKTSLMVSLYYKQPFVFVF